ncbi:MAG: hypothetical protein Q9207_006809 [Kuettlingeria erythrocarpa]
MGKAGRSRWLGIRPTVRGVAMNACDHPHGGGRGKSKGNVQPVSIWGKLVSSIPLLFLLIGPFLERGLLVTWELALNSGCFQQTKGGFKTRKKRNINRFVVQARPRKINEAKSQPKKKEKKEKKEKAKGK